jgi:hypothetical protein
VRGATGGLRSRSRTETDVATTTPFTNRTARFTTVTCAVLLTLSTLPRAEGWCDLVFKDVVEKASSVIIADYHRASKVDVKVTVAEVLKGACTDEELEMDPEELERLRLKDGDKLVIALTSYHQPVRIVRELAGCAPVSILPIRGGKLRARERPNYDFMSKSMTLEALRSDLLLVLRPGY